MAIKEGLVGFIPYGVEVEEDMTLRRFLRIGLISEVLNKGLHNSSIELKIS